MNNELIKYIIKEYGVPWAINRSLYAVKLKALCRVPVVEKLFERSVDIKRIDIFDIDIQTIKQFLHSLPKEKQIKIVADADNAIIGKLTGFASISLDYGSPINWHLQPLTQKEVDKRLKWYRIPDFDTDRGDIKVIWEASRFTHFYLFVRAYLITGERKYYKSFAEQLKSWLDNNEYSYGANYKCGQECSLRMINTLMAYSIFKSKGLTTNYDEANVKELIRRCYKKVRSNFYYAKHMRNNHTFSEICGWIVGAWCSKDDRSLKQGYRLLEKEIIKQFYLDGGYIQYSFNYQRFSLQIVECILKIEEKTKISISKGAAERIKNSVLQLYQMQDDISEDVPNYGSNDGALIFPVTACDYRNFTPVINTLYFSIIGKRLYGPGEHDEEILWFGNKKKESSVEKIEKVSTAYEKSGFYTIRSIDAFLMVFCHTFDFRPAHMDGMHIDLWHKGKNIFCDSGTYSYASDLGKGLVKTDAHNTVKMHDIEQMKSHSNFLIYKWTSCRDIKHTENSFSGTMVSKNGYEHTRNIERTDIGYRITDEVSGDGEYCEFYFHTPCGVRIVPRGFQLLDKDIVIGTIEVDIGDLINKKAYRSLYYLKKEEINCVSVRHIMTNKKCSMRFDIRFISN
ncbi:MAG TPA: heparinase II/III family protein [Ruminiclostridium sp.]